MQTDQNTIAALALDLERTLIDNAMSGRPRPGLAKFLDFCEKHFALIFIYTTVDESDAREVIADLACSGDVSPALASRLRYVNWSGTYKDLSFVSGVTPDQILIVDDDAGWIRPDQRDRWISIAPWDGGPDSELQRVQTILETRLRP